MDYMLSNTVIFLNNWCDFILIRYFGCRLQSWLPLKFNNRPPEGELTWLPVSPPSDCQHDWSSCCCWLVVPYNCIIICDRQIIVFLVCLSVCTMSNHTCGWFWAQRGMYYYLWPTDNCVLSLSVCVHDVQPYLRLVLCTTWNVLLSVTDR